jgi:hypothetical protein
VGVWVKRRKVGVMRRRRDIDEVWLWALTAATAA